MLPLAAASCASASGATASCGAAACGRGIAAAALWFTVCASLLACRWYTYIPGTPFFCFCFFFRVATLPHIPIFLLNFGGVACSFFFTSSANTLKSWWEGNSLVLAEGKYFYRNIFSQTLHFYWFSLFSLVCVFFFLFTCPLTWSLLRKTAHILEVLSSRLSVSPPTLSRISKA